MGCMGDNTPKTRGGPAVAQTGNHNPGLLDVMRDLGHGRVEDLLVAGGTPRVTERTKLFRRYRPGRPDPPAAPRVSYVGRRPHPQHERLLAHCRQVGDGVIGRVEVADGIPVHWSPA